MADEPGARRADAPRLDYARVVPGPPSPHVAASRRRQARLRRLLRLREAAREGAPGEATPRDGGSGVARS